MATNLKNLSDYDTETVPPANNFRFGIVVSEWNSMITAALLDGAFRTLLQHGATEENIITEYVPGSFELTLGAQYMAEYTDVDAVICIGCIIRGETPHFNYICDSVTQGITQLNTTYNIPFVFGVLTTDNLQQAKDRAGGKHGNKGDEAAVAAIKMAFLHNKLINKEKRSDG
ncbi:MAG: 6,7-dimethyl-8-ribityllumazine synthase [Bacteroidales bacterium]|nr:MAG: 6,7-dimethyl-8-ribityllumazine synthase [Bacteroidales bacterium]